MLLWRKTRPEKGRVERLKEAAGDKRTHAAAGVVPVLIAIVARLLAKRTTKEESK